MEDHSVPLFSCKTDYSYATKAIHVGYNPEEWESKAISPPIVLSSTFKQDEPGKCVHIYGRTSNPSRDMLEQCLAILDGGKHGLCFSSGTSAATNVVSLLNAGDHVLCVEDVYGGIVMMLKDIKSRLGIETTFVDVEAVCANLRPNTKMVWLDSLTNPMLKVIDIRKLTSKIRSFNKDILIVVDNTLLTSYFLKPLEHGADIVVQSVTKYLNGHSDVIMGVVILNDDALCTRLRTLQNCCGAVPSPFDCYLVTRGLKTLQLRMDQHMKNGLAVARFLESHPLVEKVIHPGLTSHPQHELARHTWAGYSGMCGFYIKGGLKQSKTFLKSLKIFTLAVSLGGCQSLVGLPLLTLPAVALSGIKFSDNFIRLSVGLESIQDIIEDLDQALKCTI